MFLTDEEIERKLKGETEKEPEVVDGPYDFESKTIKAIICPNCGCYVRYKVGVEFCDCGEYIQEETTVDILEELIGSIGRQEDIIEPTEVCENTGVKALRSLDGLYCLEFTGDWMKIGREATGAEYFQQAGKRKVSREHAILQKKEGAWYLSYCKKEDRNYTGGAENPIFINGRRMERTENYKLQVGDEVAFSELDKMDQLAAFFRVE